MYKLSEYMNTIPIYVKNITLPRFERKTSNSMAKLTIQKDKNNLQSTTYKTSGQNKIFC